jgi:hypothetical protein
MILIYIKKIHLGKKKIWANRPDSILDGLGKTIQNSKRFDPNRPEIYFATFYHRRF